jgi:hypothetical protein
MENESKVVIFNPCKYCLKRPVCQRQCDDLKYHVETQEMSSVFFVFFIITSLCIFGSIYIYTHYPIKIVACMLLLILGVAYGYTTEELITEHLEEFKEYNFLKKLIVLLISPTAMAAAWLFYSFDFDDMVNKYSRRYFLKG